MKKTKSRLPEREQVKNQLKYRIMLEKEYTESCAAWMMDRVESLLDYMLYGHAVIAYMKQDGQFRLATATLLYYERTFGKPYSGMECIKGGSIVYWDVEMQGWRTLQVENFLEWRPVV